MHVEYDTFCLDNEARLAIHARWLKSTYIPRAQAMHSHW